MSRGDAERRGDAVNPLYRHVLLPPVRYLTRRDAEVAMDWHLRTMRAVQRSGWALRLMARGDRAAGPVSGPPLAQELMDGLRFPHPFGIAAGLDKNAAVVPAFAAHHSPGFIEVGTVTLRPQPGNPRPRITRPDRDHLLNSMGFPNAGSSVVADNLRRTLARHPDLGFPVGVNIGKNKTSPPEQVAQEYAAVVRAFAERGVVPDYVTVNVSSPNTPGLRAMQEVAVLSEILAAVIEEMEAAARQRPGPEQRAPRRHRLLVKLAPDLTPDAFEAIVACVLQLDAGGLILTNTQPQAAGGGLSGPDLYPLSSRLVRLAAEQLPPDKVIVATGGMDTVDRVYEMLQHADLVGVYTGLVLQGPGLLRHLRDGVAARMRADGVGSLAQLRATRRVRS